MSRSRWYDDPCGIARALNLVGERWALLVVRELVLGPKRFSDLRKGLPGITPAVLTQRLNELTSRGITTRGHLGAPVSADVYSLTPLGLALEPVLLALAHWGSRAVRPESGELSNDAFIFALRTTVDPARGCPDGSYQLNLGSDRYTVAIDDGQLSAMRRGTDDPLAVIHGSATTIRGVVFGDLGVEQAIATGDLVIDGNQDAARAFLHLFERPQLTEEVDHLDDAHHYPERHA